MKPNDIVIGLARMGGKSYNFAYQVVKATDTHVYTREVEVVNGVPQKNKFVADANGEIPAPKRTKIMHGVDGDYLRITQIITVKLK